MKSLDWQDDVRCTPDMAAAFTVDYKPNPEEMTRLGLICASCPVKIQCGHVGLASTSTGFYAGIFLPSIGQGRHLAVQALARKVGAAA